MTFRYDSYCGLYCGACFVMRANEEGRVAEQAREWEREPNEITCHGCKSNVNSGYCRACGIKACAMERGLEFCVDYSEYPCERLIAFRDDEWSHHSAITRNLAELSKLGLQQWLKAQAARWRCPSCGHRTTWCDETCHACGAAVVPNRDEEQGTQESQSRKGGS